MKVSQVSALGCAALLSVVTADQQHLRKLDPRTVETKDVVAATKKRIHSHGQSEAQQDLMHRSCDPSRRLTTHQTQTFPDFINSVIDSLTHVQVGLRPIQWVSSNFGYLVQERGALVDGSWTEFGVFGGHSLRTCYDNLKVANIFQGPIAGFDSFEGLPVTWRPGFEAGRFGENKDVYTEVRNFLPQEVELYKGWFQDTIGNFLEAHPDEPSTLIHHDGDLFVSTAITFALMNERIVPGTLLCFDELLGYPDYEKHEILSLFIWMREHHATLCPIAAKGPIDKNQLLNVGVDIHPHEQSACFQVLDLHN